MDVGLSPLARGPLRQLPELLGGQGADGRPSPHPVSLIPHQSRLRTQKLAEWSSKQPFYCLTAEAAGGHAIFFLSFLHIRIACSLLPLLEGGLVWSPSQPGLIISLGTGQEDRNQYAVSDLHGGRVRRSGLSWDCRPPFRSSSASCCQLGMWSKG